MKVSLKNKNLNYDAKGEYNPNTKELTVFKESLVSVDISKAKTFRGVKAVVKEKEEFTKNSKVMEDITFKSSSTAANFITGRSSDGL